MRATLRLVFFLAVLSAIPAVHGKQGRPGVPALREADRRTNQPLEPPLEARAKEVTREKLQAEGAELRNLSAEICSKLNLVAKGQLPSDTAEKLKRIEKIAKHLRSELIR
jgi:hypothetical protein